MPQKNNIQLIITRQNTSKRPSRLFTGSQASKRPPKAPKSLQKHPKASKSLQKGLQKAFKRKKKAFNSYSTGQTASVCMYVCMCVPGCLQAPKASKSLQQPSKSLQKGLQKTFKRHSKDIQMDVITGLQTASKRPPKRHQPILTGQKASKSSKAS